MPARATPDASQAQVIVDDRKHSVDAPHDISLIRLQRLAGNKATAELMRRLSQRPETAIPSVVQRHIIVTSPRNRFFTPTQARALSDQFITVLNRISTANDFAVVGSRLQFTARAGASPSFFDARMRQWIGPGVEIPLILVRSTSRMVDRLGNDPVDVDSFKEGYVDVDDLQAEDPDSARMNVLHMIRERVATPNYARQVGSRALESDSVFNPAHRQGLVTERDYLRDRLRDNSIGNGVQLRRQPLRFRFRSAHGYAVVHTLPTRSGGQIMSGNATVVDRSGRHTLDQWMAAHPAGFP